MMEAPKKSISSNNLSSTPTTLSTTNSLTDLSKPPQPHHGPTHGTQITVMSEQDKLEMKQMRKEMKKRSKMTGKLII